MEIYVSVVVPVYNGEKYIISCLESLSSQSLPKKNVEVIVVDNCSEDNSVNIARQYNATVLKETKRGSYAARNAGVHAARGQIIGFIDVDCIASSDWIKHALSNFTASPPVEILAGRVEFIIPEKLTVWGDFDRHTFLNQEYSFRSGVAKTANMFVKREVFENAGYFNDKLLSGGDIEWTSRAVRFGASIKYEPKALVYHPVRNNFNEIAKKVYRVGTGKGQVLKEKKVRYESSNFGLKHLKHPYNLLRNTMASINKGFSFLHPIYMLFVILILSPIFISGILHGVLLNKKN